MIQHGIPIPIQILGLTGSKTRRYLSISETGQAVFSGNLSLRNQRYLAHRISLKSDAGLASTMMGGNPCREPGFTAPAQGLRRGIKGKKESVRTYCWPIGSRGVKRVPKASKVKTGGLRLDIEKLKMTRFLFLFQADIWGLPHFFCVSYSEFAFSIFRQPPTRHKNSLSAKGPTKFSAAAE